VANDIPGHKETDVAGSKVMMSMANSAAAALFDAGEDSDSSASSDMLQTTEVILWFTTVASVLFIIIWWLHTQNTCRGDKFKDGQKNVAKLWKDLENL